MLGGEHASPSSVGHRGCGVTGPSRLGTSNGRGQMVGSQALGGVATSVW